MRAPEFWYHDGWLSKLLTPLSALWCWGAEYRQSGIESFRPSIPVICVGNIVVGGTGKTPVVLALAEHLQSRGRRVHLLTRGYGGTETGPTLVAPDAHDAKRVGDEPLLLCRVAPTWVSRWRPDGAAAAASKGADTILMDDGFQNFTIAKDLSLVVVDGSVGFGNGRVMPAGPCREPVAAGLARADAIIIIGDDQKSIAQMAAPLPVLRAKLVPQPENFDLKGKRVLAFAGIGRPQKFFRMMETEIQAALVDAVAYPDHYAYKADDLETLLGQARLLDAIPVTTEKDWVRIPAGYRASVRPVGITLTWDETETLDRLLDGVLGP